MSKKDKIKLGKRKQLKIDGWVSAWCKPSGKFWKRVASKASRKSDDCSNGGCHKKAWGPFEWS